MKLILMVGLPRSGKTTKAKELSKLHNAPIVNPDAIRQVVSGTDYRQESEPLVWGVAKTMALSLFKAGHSTVIIDACNITRKRREEWMHLNRSCVLEYYVVSTPASVCQQRVVDCGSNPNLHSVIDRMSSAEELPGKDEGKTTFVEGF